MLSDFLQDYVTKNIWCAPFQDNQTILKLSRLTIPEGTAKHADVWWDDITLPDSTSQWEIYNVGQNTPWRTNFPEKVMKWVPLAYWGDKSNTIFDLYFNNGKKVPTYQAFVLLTEDMDFILALKMDQSRYDLVSSPLYLRSYHNGFWRSSRSANYKYTVEYGGNRIVDLSTLKDYISDIGILRKSPGIVNVFHNGEWVDNLNPNKVKPGDYIEYVHDGSVSRIVDFPIGSLRDFLSKLDNIQKFLLHPPKEKNGVIRYRDDVDVILYKKNADNSLTGRYYHRNVENSLRMVTHADYSIPVQNVVAYTQDPNDPWAKREELVIRLHIRDSGYSRPLVDEHRHLQELYRMTDTQIARALLGMDATLDEWYAQSLEQSYYTAVMRQWWPPFDYQSTLDMLGYDALTKILSDTPKAVVSVGGVRQIPLSPAQQADSTMYEYDSNGLYLGHYYHSTGEIYIVHNDQTSLVEIYLGEGSKILDWVKGNNDFTLLPGRMYRFYRCDKVQDVPTLNYTVAVEGKDYSITDGKCIWLHPKNANEGLLWSDKKFLINDVTWHSVSGVYRLTINHSATNATPLPIPPEQLMLIVNGNSAVEGVDYVVRWPEIMILSTRLMDFTKENVFVITGLGMSPDTNRNTPDDVGFVFQGILSNNKHFDLRDDRVMRVVVDGQVKQLNQVTFAEDYPGDSSKRSVNGAVFESRPLYVPIRDITYQQFDKLRNSQIDFDKRLEDFLTVRYPQHNLTGPNPIKARYELYSPFITQLLYDIQEGTLEVPVVPENMDDIQRKMEPYLEMLDFEPVMIGTDSNYVHIVAHPWKNMVQVNSLTYRFLTKIVDVYLKSGIELNTHLMIKD